MQATAVMQAGAVTPATSNSKDDSNCMTIHNRRNKRNSRNESKKRADNTGGTPAKAVILAKLVKPATACKDSTTAWINHKHQE
jgi:hypothetical protein